MLANGAVRLAGDVFVAATEDVDDAVLVLADGEVVEAPLQRAYPFDFSAAKGQAASASCDGAFVLFAAEGVRGHMLLQVADQKVTIFETPSPVRAVAWHPSVGDLVLLLLADGTVEVYCASHALCGAAMAVVTILPLAALCEASAPQPAGDRMKNLRTHQPNAQQRAALADNSANPPPSFTAMCFLSRAAGEPTMLAVATERGSVYVLKLVMDGPRSVTPASRPTRPFTEFLDRFPHDHGPYMRLVIEPSNHAALALHSFLADVRGGVTYMALLSADGAVRLHVLYPDQIFTVTRRASAPFTPAACEIPLFAPLTHAAAQQADNVLLYSDGASAFVVALPAWCRATSEWRLRYASHEGALNVAPVGRDREAVPMPLALRLPFDCAFHSVALGADRLVLVPHLYGACVSSTDAASTGAPGVIDASVAALLEVGQLATFGSVAPPVAHCLSLAGTTQLSAAFTTAAEAARALLEASPADDTSAADGLLDAATKNLQAVQKEIAGLRGATQARRAAASQTAAALRERVDAITTRLTKSLDDVTELGVHGAGADGIRILNAALGDLHALVTSLEQAGSSDADRIAEAVRTLRIGTSGEEDAAVLTRTAVPASGPQEMSALRSPPTVGLYLTEKKFGCFKPLLAGESTIARAVRLVVAESPGGGPPNVRAMAGDGTDVSPREVTFVVQKASAEWAMGGSEGVEAVARWCARHGIPLLDSPARSRPLCVSRSSAICQLDAVLNTHSTHSTNTSRKGTAPIRFVVPPSWRVAGGDGTQSFAPLTAACRDGVPSSTALVVAKPEMACQAAGAHDLLVAQAGAVGGVSPTGTVVQAFLADAMPLVFKVYVAAEYVGVSVVDASALYTAVRAADGPLAIGPATKHLFSVIPTRGPHAPPSPPPATSSLSAPTCAATLPSPVPHAADPHYFAEGSAAARALRDTLRSLRAGLGVDFFGLDVIVVRGGQSGGEGLGARTSIPTPVVDRGYIVDFNYMPSYKDEAPDALIASMLQAARERGAERSTADDQ